MIGAARYFANAYFAPRYWPKLGAELVVVVGVPEPDWICVVLADDWTTIVPADDWTVLV